MRKRCQHLMLSRSVRRPQLGEWHSGSTLLNHEGAASNNKDDRGPCMSPINYLLVLMKHRVNCPSTRIVIITSLQVEHRFGAVCDQGVLYIFEHDTNLGRVGCTNRV